jgi:hypothetical protein
VAGRVRDESQREGRTGISPWSESTGVRLGPGIRASAASPSHRVRRCGARAGCREDPEQKVGEKDERERVTRGVHRSAIQGQMAR